MHSCRSLVLCWLFASSCFLRAEDQKPIRVLILDGRNNHAWEGTTHALKQILQQTGAFEVAVSSSPPPFSQPRPQRPLKGSEAELQKYDADLKWWQEAEKKYEKSIEAQWQEWRPKFKEYDVVVDNYLGPDWNADTKADFVQFVRDGGGVVVIHAANNGFSNWHEFNQMLGIGWRKSEQGVRVTIDDATGKQLRQPVGEGPASAHGQKHPYVVKTRIAEHPILRGMPTEWLHGTDELYHSLRGPADGVTVLATAYSDERTNGSGQHEPVLWTTQFGAGRVITNSMGHYWVGAMGESMRHSLHCVGFQTIFARSCQWAAKREVTLDVPLQFPTKDRLAITHPEELAWQIAGQPARNSPSALASAKERAEQKKKLNPYAMLSPEESITRMQLPLGYRLELLVGEPHIQEPVLCTWDGNGRLYVAEMRSYMQDEFGTGTKSLKNGRISRHEDTDGDGVLDRHTVFVEGLNLPRMMLTLDDRLAVIETDSANVVAYRDADGDGVADEKTMLYESKRKISPTTSVEHQDSGLLWSLDNWIYLSRGTERYRFTRGKWELEPIEFDWNQWGVTQDDSGRLYFNENSTPVKSYQQHPYYWTLIRSRAKGKWNKSSLGNDCDNTFLNMHSICNYGDRGEPHAYQAFTSATGGCVYRGDALPLETRGNYFICEPTGHIVRRAKIERIAGKITPSNADAPEAREFLASDDINFRPVSAHSAPDGSLVIVDMYRGMIQDAPWVDEKMQPFLRNTGLNFNIQHGRIYRVVHESKRTQTPPKLLALTTEQLVEHLASENGWMRDTAQRLIILRTDRASALSALRAMAIQHPKPLARLHALWTLEGCDALTGELLTQAVKDTDWRVREGAVRMSEPWLVNKDELVWQAISDMSLEMDPNVARQLILSLGFSQEERATTLIDSIIARHLTNEVVFLSAMTSLYQRETPMIKRIQSGEAFRTIKDSTLRINTQRRWNVGIANWKQESAPPRPLDDEALELVREGATIYAQLCINCHGENGRGTQLPGQLVKAPPLAGSPRVLGQKEVLGRILLHGLIGPVDGQEYREVMAPNDKYDDRWIASVASYIRQEWGNLASVIRPGDVTLTRKSSQGRYRAWSHAELQRFALPELTDRALWKANASSGADSAAKAINDSIDSCDNPNQPGRWFQLDLGDTHIVTSLTLYSSETRYPRGYELLVSTDEKNWSPPVATGKGEGIATVISFEPTVGRFFKVIQTGRDDNHRWSIERLKVFGVRGELAVTASEQDEGPLPPLEELIHLSGNAEQGAVIFGKTCATCHQIKELGVNFGPELTKVASRLKKHEIMQSILQPNAVVDEKYRGEIVITSEGKLLSGFIIEETADKLKLRAANNLVHDLVKNDIDDRNKMTTSFMPSGLERSMTKQQFLDLVAYLLNCK